MKTRYHIEITQKALGKYFSSGSMEAIIDANISQDRIVYQFGHDHFHFDGSAFAAGFSYIAEQEEQVIHCIDEEDFSSARAAFGRMTHTWQDFYAHSNYVTLWVDSHGWENPELIDFKDAAIMQNPLLRSGKNYGVIEFIALLPGISKLIRPLMPPDSHAQMNLDDPAAGELFIYAYWGAFKRTRDVFNKLLLQLNGSHISQIKISAFLGR